MDQLAGHTISRFSLHHSELPAPTGPEDAATRSDHRVRIPPSFRPPPRGTVILTNSPSAGIIGLSIGVRLQQAGHHVTIVARDFPGPFETIDPQAQINYTSPWGGAHNRWVPPGPDGADAREHAMALRTFRHMAGLAAAHPEAGITWMRGIEYLEAPSAAYQILTDARAAELGMEGFRTLGRDEFPDDRVQWGCEYRTWCVNPMVYCMFLLRRLTFHGGKIVRRELRDPAEVFALGEDVLGEAGKDLRIVVNASGTGFGDKDSFIIRGMSSFFPTAPDAALGKAEEADYGRRLGL